MIAFLQYLPVEAYSFNGDVSADDRLIFSTALPGTPPTSDSEFGRVLCRAGWGDQGWDKVNVIFYLPPKGGAGAEQLSVCVRVAAWGRLAPQVFKTMICSSAPLGVVDFPL